ncbi:hypothetical protein BJY24_007062 [Nocardia transvalensis]|uniref:Uncharacterized protein n=1 Tax=Nocardia transvalensis TaxID=37333 RepID=A0A7W9UMU5_9NOCA|nr:hypothetical protein [Nocardia transvalensis]
MNFGLMLAAGVPLVVFAWAVWWPVSGSTREGREQRSMQMEEDADRGGCSGG